MMPTLETGSIPDDELRYLASRVPNIPYRITARFPHDERAFTEGLVFSEGTLYESTGSVPRRSISALRQVEISSGRILRRRSLKKVYFAEGLTILDGTVFQLTLDGKGFVYDLDTLNLVDAFFYLGEVWGLTNDGTSLIMSNGSSSLQRIDPETFRIDSQKIEVTIEGKPLSPLNELEFVDGALYANVLDSDFIFRINPTDGKVLGYLDISKARPRTGDVLNGIAYDRVTQSFLITGKFWPTLLEIQFKKD